MSVSLTYGFPMEHPNSYQPSCLWAVTPYHFDHPSEFQDFKTAFQYYSYLVSFTACLSFCTSYFLFWYILEIIGVLLTGSTNNIPPFFFNFLQQTCQSIFSWQRRGKSWKNQEVKHDCLKTFEIAEEKTNRSFQKWRDISKYLLHCYHIDLIKKIN